MHTSKEINLRILKKNLKRIKNTVATIYRCSLRDSSLKSPSDRTRYSKNENETIDMVPLPRVGRTPCKHASTKNF